MGNLEVDLIVDPKGEDKENIFVDHKKYSRHLRRVPKNEGHMVRITFQKKLLHIVCYHCSSEPEKSEIVPVNDGP